MKNLNIPLILNLSEELKNHDLVISYFCTSWPNILILHLIGKLVVAQYLLAKVSRTIEETSLASDLIESLEKVPFCHVAKMA